MSTLSQPTTPSATATATATPSATAAFLEPHVVIRWCAWLAIATVIGMIAIFVGTGTGQDPLQYVHTPEVYAGFLLADPAALRATIGLDDAFIVLYSVAFAAYGVQLVRSGANAALVRVACGLLLAVGLLDMIENFHFLAMLASAELGVVPSSTEISAQVVESLVKFHVSYLGLFLFGVLTPRRTAPERLLSNLSLFVQAPVGILIYVTPESVALPLVFVRFAYFVVGLGLIAETAGRAPSR